MKTKILLLFLICCPVLLCAQDESGEKFTRMNVDLGVGNIFQLDQTSVRFLKVVSDSRCPRLVTCIWEGEAKVLLGIKVNGKYFEKEVIVSGSEAELSLTENLQMNFSYLRPYPETGLGIAPEDYCLSFGAIFKEEN